VPSDSPYRADIEEIRKGADRAASLTQQLLAFSRRQILQPRVLDIDQAVTGVDTLLRRLIGEDITLTTALESGGACVSADLGRVEQILMNLAVNARDAMPNGGQLNISTRVVDVDEDFTRANPGSRTGRFVQITVTDSGQGMSEDTLSHLFEPFFTTKALGRGTGLGLATVYGVVKQSNGYIRVESKLGAGTRFDILLPLVEAEPTPAHEVQLPAAASAQDATVLVAEDEDAVRSLACRVLRKHGFNVLEASNGAHAIEVARNHDGVIHLLLSDLVMPQLGGRELAEQLMAARPNIKVVFMSGYSSDALMQRGINHAKAGFLEKPFTPNALVSKIRELLSST
jgi:CheY-like chemotaxis protein